jgi:hypothetical protein
MECDFEIGFLILFAILGFLSTRVKKFADRVNKPYPAYVPEFPYFVDICKDGIFGGFIGAVAATLAHFFSVLLLPTSLSQSAAPSNVDKIMIIIGSIPFVCGTGILFAVTGGVFGGIITDFLIRKYLPVQNKAYVALGGGIVSSIVTLIFIVL